MNEDYEYIIIFIGYSGFYFIGYNSDVNYHEIKCEVRNTIRNGMKLNNIVKRQTGEIMDSEIEKIMFS